MWDSLTDRKVKLNFNNELKQINVTQTTLYIPKFSTSLIQKEGIFMDRSLRLK